MAIYLWFLTIQATAHLRFQLMTLRVLQYLLEQLAKINDLKKKISEEYLERNFKNYEKFTIYKIDNVRY